MDLLPGSPLWRLYIYYKSVGGYRYDPEIDHFWSFLVKITLISAILTIFGSKSAVSAGFGLFFVLLAGFFAKITILWAFCVLFINFWPEIWGKPMDFKLGKSLIRLR
jgi:hypothetical protein